MKTIALKNEVHHALKLRAVELKMTFDEAIVYLLDVHRHYSVINKTEPEELDQQ